MNIQISEQFSKVLERLHADPGERPPNLFHDQKPIAVYGMGSVGRDVFTVLARHGLPVYYILDKKATPGARWQGVPILHPDTEQIPATERQAIHLVIGIFNAYVDIPALVAYLKGLGYTEITTFLDLHTHFSAELGDRYWLTNRSYYQSRESEIRSGYEVWQDEKSRNLYTAILELRLSGTYTALLEPDYNQQYLPSDIPAWSSPMRFVDCGAYDGDTIQQMLQCAIKFDAVAAFEPDQANFIKLAKFVRSIEPGLPNTVSLFPNAVHSCTEQLGFSASGSSGSHISALGESVIQGVSLDESLPRFRPSLIKMDIEGSEYDALWGARQIIQQYKPELSICLYHRPEHLWQIPLLINKFNPGIYHLYLRVHCYSGFELVLYAIPIRQ